MRNAPEPRRSRTSRGSARGAGGSHPNRPVGEDGRPRRSRGREPARTEKPRRPRRDLARAFKPFTPEQLAARAAAIPVIDFPDLPVSARKDEIAAAIRDHQVVIVSGETGSGKTTQLPKICMQLGRGVTGMIGHTQPRRIAARSVADRIAHELGQTVGREAGKVIGYQVRFTDEVGETTLVKLMTDGILLAEIQSDPLLRRYDTLIIDEAHERSLNIDFILGYLARLLPARPDLKVIITSATIDSARFAAHFGRWEGTPGRGILLEAAPVIEVSGRTFPVEVRYRPLAADAPSSYTSQSSDAVDEGDAEAGMIPGPEQFVLEDPDDDLPTLGYGLGDDIDVEQAICHAVDELCSEGDGDILVFLPGERDIRDTEQALLDHLGPRAVRAGDTAKARSSDIEIVPLFARLSAAEQQRVFEDHRLRRIVLATNVAETSLTVPGIRYVIDPGLARVSRYSNRTKVQRLPIEPISQASANQRAGRCGRVADGIAIRLYSQRDYESRPRFTEPEILRTSLASVILQMAALGLGSIADFPFLDAPDSRAVRDGISQLVEIGALEDESSPSSRRDRAPRRASALRPDSASHRLTAIGRDLAHLPIDPRLGRILFEGDANGCASEVLVIVAALSIQDVRERPLDHQAAADAAHARFADPHSDFITYLNLWRYLSVCQRDLSGAAFRRMCRAEFLHYLRFREWRDVVIQLTQMARPLDLDIHPIGEPSARDVIEAASIGGLEGAAARAVVAYTQGHESVDADEIHRSLLVGLLSNLGSWDEGKRDYEGARGTHFTIWPGSGLAKSHPAWVMTAELVETSRLFARTVARIKPEWIEPLAKNLVKRVYSEPFWSSSKGAAMVKEKVLLYGLTLVADRSVLLGRLDLIIDEGSGVRRSVAAAGTLAGIAQGLIGGGEDEGPHDLGSVGRDFLAMAECGECDAAGSADGSTAKTHTVSSGEQVNADQHTALTSDNTNSAPSELIASGETVCISASPTALTARELAREMFIRHALVEGQWRERHRFQSRNDELLEQAREVERRSRTHGLVADEEARARFFDDILPDDIVSAVHFNRWWKRERETHPDLLTYTSQLLLPRGTGGDSDGFPDYWECAELRLPLSYEFTPGSARDGVTVRIPIEVLERISDEGMDWLVPGMLDDLVTETIRALTKAKRRLLAPAPQVGAQAAEWMRCALAGEIDEEEAAPVGAPPEEADPMSLSAAMDRLAAWSATTRKARADSAEDTTGVPDAPQAAPTSGVDWSGERPAFADAFRTAMRILRGVDVTPEEAKSALDHLPDHLKMTLVVVDRTGRELGSGSDLVALQRKLARRADDAIRTAVRGAVADAMEDARDRKDTRGRPSTAKPDKTSSTMPQELDATGSLHLDGLTSFPDTPLPRSIDSPGTQMTLRGYPALVAQGSANAPAAGVRVMANAQEADRRYREGLARLLLLRVRLADKRVTTRWTGRQALMLAASPYAGIGALVADAQWASALSLVDELCAAGPSSIRDAAAFEEVAARARNLHEDRVFEILSHVVRALDAQSEAESAMRTHTEPSVSEVVADVRTQVSALVYEGFVGATPAWALPHLARYLRAGAVRIDRASSSAGALGRDVEDMDRIHSVAESLAGARDDAAARPYDAALAARLEQARWMLEELRVSCFAQQLGTPHKVSFKRVLSLIEQAR